MSRPKEIRKNTSDAMSTGSKARVEFAGEMTLATQRSSDQLNGARPTCAPLEVLRSSGMVRPVKLAAKDTKDIKYLHNGWDAAPRRSEPEWRRTAQRAVPTFRVVGIRTMIRYATSLAMADG